MKETFLCPILFHRILSILRLPEIWGIVGWPVKPPSNILSAFFRATSTGVTFSTSIATAKSPTAPWKSSLQEDRRDETSIWPTTSAPKREKDDDDLFRVTFPRPTCKVSVSAIRPTSSEITSDWKDPVQFEFPHIAFFLPTSHVDFPVFKRFRFCGSLAKPVGVEPHETFTLSALLTLSKWSAKDVRYRLQWLCLTFGLKEVQEIPFGSDEVLDEEPPSSSWIPKINWRGDLRLSRDKLLSENEDKLCLQKWRKVSKPEI